jgi:hypothetical protein
LGEAKIMSKHSSQSHTYFVVAKFSSKTPVSAQDVEYQVMKALQDLGEGIDVEIVQLGNM